MGYGDEGGTCNETICRGFPDRTETVDARRQAVSNQRLRVLLQCSAGVGSLPGQLRLELAFADLETCDF